MIVIIILYNYYKELFYNYKQIYDKFLIDSFIKKTNKCD